MNIKGVVIDAGHGGDDPGAIGNNIVEKDLTLKISEELYNKLKSLGIPVYLTRSTDETLSPTERINRILNAFGNSKDVIVISNHINAGGGDGAEVIYALRNNSTLSNLILDALYAAGQNTRKAYQMRSPSDTSKDYYFIHRDTGVTEPVIVEYGFLDSTGDDVNQLKNNYIEYADAVAKAIAQYVNAPYTSENTYIVQSGDSLWSIAKKFNISVEELKSYNNLFSNLLSIGQVLEIPKEQPSGEYKIYIVQSGDSLYKIANLNNITVKELMDYNNLGSSSLKIGQTLLIPIIKEEQAPTEYITYTVKSGDSLYAIAKKYNTNVDEIKQLNNLTTNLLSIGQVIKIPVKDMEKEIETSSYIEYAVQPGDSLYSIGRKYGVSVDSLKNYNKLESTLLSIGQIIKIPITTTDTIYVVKSGDNLYSIAQKYNTTVDSIKDKNNLTSNQLSIGQKLII